MSRQRNSRHDIERYARLFATRAHVVKSSAMRDMMSITNRPEVISLAGGLPDTKSFPPELLESVMATMARRNSAELLQYGPTEGHAIMKDCIVEVMAEEGMTIDPDDLLVTTGGQQVIDLVTRTLVDPGDTIIAEAPTYPGAVPSFSSFQANVVQIDMDDDGMKIDRLEETLERLDREGILPKFIYTIPTFQNPAGVTMSLERRKRLVEIAQERELLVLEDNPYGMLRYSGEPLPTLRSLDGGEFVMYLGTFSKIFAPGIRMGWLEAPAPVLAKVNIAKQAADLCPSSLSQYLITTYFEQADWRDFVNTARDIYVHRRDAMLGALERYFPTEATWTRPDGGLFIWASLPEVIDTTDLLAKALSANVAFVPGEGAFLDGRGKSSMRLNFSGVAEDEIVEGVRRIGEVIAGQLDLWRKMTGEHRAVAPPSGAEPAGSERPGRIVSIAGRKLRRAGTKAAGEPPAPDPSESSSESQRPNGSQKRDGA
ncbi:MAG TPA: PLP-dependent aminotransferase family protein [Solirubrobacterales bacterium]|nr:PLP-dependent aminotransferase family protein [Solirubrobacterales bacterium]